MAKILRMLLFLSTPSARRATSRFLRTRQCARISIHALREEGDIRHRKCSPFRSHFYPRPPRGGRRSSSPIRLKGDMISIHALREEGDPSVADTLAVMNGISIHALREEGDLLRLLKTSLNSLFLSTPSARRATPRHIASFLMMMYFYPRPPRGGRRGIRFAATVILRFLSTPSARRATYTLNRLACNDPISIHALREEGDELRSGYSA